MLTRKGNDKELNELKNNFNNILKFSSVFIDFYKEIPQKNDEKMQHFISFMPCIVMSMQEDFNSLKTKIAQDQKKLCTIIQSDVQNPNLSNDLSTICQNNETLQNNIQQFDEALKYLANHYPPHSCKIPDHNNKTPTPSSENEPNNSDENSTPEEDYSTPEEDSNTSPKIKTENNPVLKHIFNNLDPLYKEIDELLIDNMNRVGNLASALVTLNKNHESNILNTLRELHEYFESLHDLNKKFHGLIKIYENSFMVMDKHNKENSLNTMQNSLNTMQNNLNNLITDYKKMNKTQILNLKNELLNKYNKTDIINKIEALNIIITTNNNKLNAELEKFINLLATSDAE